MKNKFLINIIFTFFIISTNNILLISLEKNNAKTFNPPIKDPEITVDIYKADKSVNGTTIFADYHTSGKTRIIEVNMNGELIWEYILPSNLKNFTNPGLDVEWLSNDNILFVLPGNGVYEINRKGEIVWQYITKEISHDADRLPDGNTIFGFGGGDDKNNSQIKEINKDGKIVWQWYAKDHYNISPYKNISIQGWTHTNSVVRLNTGNTIISLRNFALIIEVDKEGNILWEFDINKFGKNPHEPKTLDSDNLIFACRRKGWDPVIEIDKRTKKAVWEFSTNELDLIRGVQPLLNGNFLLTGRSNIIEITKDKEIVWRLQVKNIINEERPGAPEDKPDKYLYKAERIVK